MAGYYPAVDKAHVSMKERSQKKDAFKLEYLRDELASLLTCRCKSQHVSSFSKLGSAAAQRLPP